ncbi:histidinol-phosphate transaminase [Emticicia sp. BO119]|uniref:pyridoxal phosphate-dependent aminotransferase n=1 Tax=Emticicia sp. BO119 TaxID=2757768 RepID=UPI0015F03687|nr:histidinol-phosphate transaminase [Emticicia sp. BO119]MBA4851079.1 histidinol-phosphate aminotransferase family protein [Emticicia sp. BO119]
MNSTEQLIASTNKVPDYSQIEQMLCAESGSHDIMRLHCNETAFDIPQNLKQQLVNKMAEAAWNRYPDFHQTQLHTLIAKEAGLSPENIVLGNGSSQLIQQIINCCSKFLSEAIIENPTFTLYHQICQNERMPYRQWDIWEGGFFNLNAFPKIAEPSLIILTSPNNPTGASLPLTTLKNLLGQYANCIFVVDEAYGEFGGESALTLVNEYANLVVLKTFSKGYGLPAIRFGYAAGSASLISLIKKYTIPFTINVFTEVVVTEALNNPVFIKALKVNQERVKNLRDFVLYLLNEMADETSFKALPSASNFILLYFQDTRLLEQVKSVLTARNILVSYPLAQCLRLTIGTEVEMNTVLRLIKSALNQYNSSIKELLAMSSEHEVIS